MSTGLPRELLDIIIDDLRTDGPSLRACALSFRAMVPFAQSRLFYKVVLGHAQKSLESVTQRTPCEKLSRLLESSPHLASFIRDLRIVDNDPRLDPWVLSEARTLSRILPLFDLKRISVRCKREALDWDKMHRELKTSLLRIFASPRLEAIQLHGLLLSAPPECPLFHVFKDSQPNLQHLSFSYRLRDKRRRSLSPPPVWAPKLCSLVIDADYAVDLLDGFSSAAMDYSRLRTLILSGFSFSEMNKVLYAMKDRNVLEHLSIVDSGSENTSEANLDGLRFLTNLRTIRYRLYLVFEFMTLLGHLAANAPLEKIVFEVFVHNAVYNSISDWTALALATKALSKPVKVLLGEYGVRDPRPGRLAFCLNECFERSKEALATSSRLTITEATSYVPLSEMW
ncbi:hypothetical protein MVEN_00753400 [Mycena venus]|uniref:Uncharacterized protein n=1 Tax=Mycena venus TaxID=2733690 RepID=A0A8H6YL37_9AGAR|nr:hypothetical protein MVEN_00753400 [Mycena venus]